MGVRANAQGFDLNRDWVKLEAPETRAMVRFLTEWDPHLTIDTHTTNGSQHRYTMTYETPLNTATHPAINEFLRSERQVQQAVPDILSPFQQIESEVASRRWSGSVFVQADSGTARR